MNRGETAFGGLLRRSRHAAWLTQEELAERSGLSARTIQGIERGQVTRPQRESVRLLADALGLAGTPRAEFEAAARRDLGPASQVCVRCMPVGELAARLHERGLDAVASEVATLLAWLLEALGSDEIGYGVTGSRVSDHTLPVQVLPGD